MISIMVMEDMKIGSSDSSSIRETEAVPFSGWYLLNKALVSMTKKHQLSRFSLLDNPPGKRNADA
jgi:hypothetical protein